MRSVWTYVKIGVVVSCLVPAVAVAESPAHTDEGQEAAPADEPLTSDEDFAVFMEEHYFPEFAREHKISVGDARDAAVDSEFLYDFMMEHADHPSFGAVYTDYGNGQYTAHLRLLDHALDAAAERLNAQLTSPAPVHYGGASGVALDEATAALTAAGEGFSVSRRHGEIVVRTPKGAGIVASIAGEFYRVEPASTEPVERAMLNYAGADAWVSSTGTAPWSWGCSVGFLWGLPNQRKGFVTAGHCPPGGAGRELVHNDNPGIRSGTTVSSTCTRTEDSRVTYLEGADPGVGNSIVNQIYNPKIYREFKLAGGVFEGQQTYKFGQSRWGLSGTNSGSVIEYGDNDLSAWSACPPNAFVTIGLHTTNNAKRGDSGGAVLVLYGANEWFLAGITRAGYGALPRDVYANTEATWYPEVALPSGGWICRFEQLCS